jgi:hypothetical protein
VDAEKVFSGETVTRTDNRFDYGEVRQISAGFSANEWSSSYGLNAARAARLFQ